jgi:hypothetical protein
MPQNPDNVVNPDLVDVADQGDGPTVVDQPVLAGPSTNPGELVQGIAGAPGLGNDLPDQPVTTGPSTNPGATVAGGTYSPQSPSTINTTQNTVVGQVYGQGDPSSVFV